MSLLQLRKWRGLPQHCCCCLHVSPHPRVVGDPRTGAEEHCVKSRSLCTAFLITLHVCFCAASRLTLIISLHRCVRCKSEGQHAKPNVCIACEMTRDSGSLDERAEKACGRRAQDGITVAEHRSTDDEIDQDVEVISKRGARENCGACQNCGYLCGPSGCLVVRSGNTRATSGHSKTT